MRISSLMVLFWVFFSNIGLLGVSAYARLVTGIVRVGPPLEIAVQQAAKVARVRIMEMDSEPIGIDYDVSNPCGRIYKAQVVEAFKGGGDPFSFFGSERMTLEVGRDYLVIVYKRREAKIQEAFRVLDDAAEPSELSPIFCRTRQEYYLPLNYVSYWLFDSVLSERSKKEWLLRSEDEVEWCSYDELPRRGALEARTEKSGAKTTNYISWESARKLVIAAINNPPFFFGVVRNPFFARARC